MPGLKLNVSSRVYNRMSKPVQSRFTKNFEYINREGNNVLGKTFNISPPDAYMIANKRSMRGVKRDLEELLEELDLMLHGGPPDWIIEHNIFARKVFDELIHPHTRTLQAWMRDVDNLLDFLESPRFYKSFQAVYYADRNGYISVHVR